MKNFQKILTPLVKVKGLSDQLRFRGLRGTVICVRVPTGGEISTRLPARPPGDFQLLVQVWSRGKNFFSSPGPGLRALLSSPGLSIPAGNPGVPDMEQY